MSAFSTELTELFQIEAPIFCGGLMWLSDAAYVSAVVRAGAMAFMTPRSFPDLDAFRAALEDCRARCEGRPFGVNLYISTQKEANQALEAWIDLSLEAGVRHFETAGLSPGPILPRLKEAGAVVIHKCTAIRHALRAEREGVDAISLVGYECGGHPGAAPLSAFTLGALAAERLSRPFIIGGGVGTGRQLFAALALGAGGVILGSRMLVSEEIWAHRHYKEKLISLDEYATTTVLEPFRRTYRCLANESSAAIAALEERGEQDFERYRPHVAGALAAEAYRSGESEKGILSLGPAVSFADTIKPAAEIIAQLMAEATAAQQTFHTRGLSR